MINDNVIRELELHGNCKMNTKGVSMRPLFKSNDAATLNAVDRDIKKYDIVLYIDAKGRYILHRVIGFFSDGYVIRGDNTFEKEFVKSEQVKAYLISFNRKGKNHTVSEFGYKFYSRFWNFIYPVRFLIRKAHILLSKIKRKLIK